MEQFIEKHLKYFILFTENDISELLPEEFEFDKFKFTKKEYMEENRYFVEYNSGHKKLSCGGTSRFTANAFMACIVMVMGAILPERYIRKLSGKVPVSDAIVKKVFDLFKKDQEAMAFFKCEACGKCQEKEEHP